MDQNRILELQEAQQKTAAVIGMLAEYIDISGIEATEYMDTVAGAVMELRDLIYTQRDRIQSLVG